MGRNCWTFWMDLHKYSLPDGRRSQSSWVGLGPWTVLLIWASFYVQCWCLILNSKLYLLLISRFFFHSQCWRSCLHLLSWMPWSQKETCWFSAHHHTQQSVSVRGAAAGIPGGDAAHQDVLGGEPVRSKFTLCSIFNDQESRWSTQMWKTD